MKGKTIVLGVSGGIAAYKIADLTSKLARAGGDVHVIMTKNATEFITPLTFETLSGNKCVTDTFERDFKWDVSHVSLAKKADIFMVAPATANIIAKIAGGIADDMLTTTILASECPKIIAPSMNIAMYKNQITFENIEKLKKYGFTIIEPDTGFLACGDTGKGRLPGTEILFHNIVKGVLYKKDLSGLKILVTAGATKEKIDPVRYITNHSSGKMGCAIANAGVMRGADVTLIGGDINVPPEVKYIPASDAMDMYDKIKERFSEFDFIIKAAAVADYRPDSVSDEKIKKSDEDFYLKLTRNKDILEFLGSHKKEWQVLCGFSMETENLIENSRNKLAKKNADIIAANNLRQEGAGFGLDTNVVTLITKEGETKLPLLRKSEIGHIILSTMLKIRNEKRRTI